MMQHGTVTTTGSAHETYYDIPPIRAPHWRWLVILYFFMEGIAGATFAIATLADLFGKDRHLVRVGRYLSFLMGLPSPILLTLDLGRPDRALHMFRILKLKSPMSLGAWTLLIIGSLSGLVAAMEFIAGFAGRNLFQGARRALSIVGLPFSLLVSGYTGTLLEVSVVPLWGRSSPLLGPAFISSAFSTALASLGLTIETFESGESAGTARALARSETIAMAIELSLLMAIVARLGKLGRPLTAGPLGAIFWPVTVGGGLVTPLLIHLSALARGKRLSAGQRIIASLLTLVGGFSLRALMIFAGRESARQPQDYFDYTR